jgi:translation elongation factor EF-4
MNYISNERIMLVYEMPMTEVAENHFFNELKQVSSGYARYVYTYFTILYYHTYTVYW